MPATGHLHQPSKKIPIEAEALFSITFLYIFDKISNFILFLTLKCTGGTELSTYQLMTRSRPSHQSITMHFHLLSTLATFALFVGLELASASVAGHVDHAHRHASKARLDGRYHQQTPRADATRCAVSRVDLQAFQVETETFQEWIRAWLATAETVDPKSAIAQVKQEFQAYNMWMKAWLDFHIFVEGGLPSVSRNSSSPATIPITPAPAFAQAYIPNGVTPMTSPSFPSSPIKVSTSAHPTLPAIVTASANGLTTTPTPVPSQSAIESKELVVYYGQSNATADTTLAQVCENKDVDMVILAFLTNFAGPGGYPTINFGAACGGQTQQMLSAGAAGLLSCPLLASYITKCQEMGKKVLLSLGGGTSDVALPDDEYAKTVATQLWNLFGAGKGEDAGLRPFGNVTLDGFDIGEFCPPICNQLAILSARFNIFSDTHTFARRENLVANIAFLLFR